MLQAGTYRGKAQSWALTETKSGIPQMAVEFITLDIEGTPGPHITWFGSFTDKALEITLKALRAMGWQGTDISAVDGLDTNEVELVIEHETYEGKTSAKVKWVNAPGGVATKAPMEPMKAKAFAAGLRAKIAGLDAVARQGAPKSKPPVLSPEPPHPAEGPDGLPF